MIAFEIDAIVDVEDDTFALKVATLHVIAAGPGAATDLTAGVDHPMPGNWPFRGHGVQGVADLAGVAGEPGEVRDLAIGGDPPARYPAGDCVDPGVVAIVVTRHPRMVTETPGARHSDAIRPEVAPA